MFAVGAISPSGSPRGLKARGSLATLTLGVGFRRTENLQRAFVKKKGSRVLKEPGSGSVSTESIASLESKRYESIGTNAGDYGTIRTQSRAQNGVPSSSTPDNSSVTWPLSEFSQNTGTHSVARNLI